MLTMARICAAVPSSTTLGEFEDKVGPTVHPQFSLFLDASWHLYKRVCLLVHLSVCQSISPCLSVPR